MSRKAKEGRSLFFAILGLPSCFFFMYVFSIFVLFLLPFGASQNAVDDRDAENKLVILLGFDNFDFIKILRKNRLKG